MTPGEYDFRTGGAMDHLSARRDQMSRTLPGQVLGGYRLVELMGSGGMGLVFRAEPLSEHLDRQVAIKVLARQVGQGDAGQDFVSEAQIHSRLAHPNIAHLYDAGISDQGWPFLVMELVDGQPIDDYCHEKALGIRQRVEMVAEVTDAVAYAHGNLVLHRDIKPVNVIVDESGRPKLLDFGIAQVLDADGGSAGGPMSLTPAFASPEQILGEKLTTATDVFQLGGLLYAVLCGQPPFPEETVETARRRAESGETTALWDGYDPGRDLRSIIERCLEKEPSARYPDARGLAADLQRYLDGYPVQATHPGWGSRASKFLRRNVVASGVTAVLLIALVVANFVYLQRLKESRDAAERSAAQSEAVTEFLIDLFDASDPTVASGDDLTASQLLEVGTRRVETDLFDQPELQADLFGALGRVYWARRNAEMSKTFLTRARELRQQLGKGEDPVALASLATVEAYLGNFAAPEIPKAMLQRAMTLHLAESGADLEYANMLSTRALFENNFDRDYAAALATIDEAEAIYDSLSAQNDPKRILGLVQKLRAHERLGEFAQAQVAGEAGIAIAVDHFGDDHERTMVSRFFVARVLESQGRYKDGAQMMERVAESNERVYGLDDMRTADTLLNLAHLQRMSGDLESATSTAERAVDAARNSEKKDEFVYATALSVLARCYEEGGEYDLADPLLHESLELYVRLEGPDSPSAAYGHKVYGDFLATRGDFEGAAREHGRALEIQNDISGPDKPDSAQLQLALGRDQLYLGNLEDAESLIFDALEVHEQFLDDDHLRMAENFEAIGELRLIQSRHDQCEEPLQKAIEIRSSKLPADHASIAIARGILGDCVYQGGDQGRGAQLMKSAVDALKANPSEFAQRTRVRLEKHTFPGQQQ